MVAGKPFFMKGIVIDYWRTPIHGDKIGIYEHEFQQAQARIFTKDKDIYGKVLDGDQLGIYSIRKDAWEPNTKKELEYYTRKRLVIRWFHRREGLRSPYPLAPCLIKIAACSQSHVPSFLAFRKPF
nr:hypothetical protein [Candidatus Sigynarchaeum springense]